MRKIDFSLWGETICAKSWKIFLFIELVSFAWLQSEGGCLFLNWIVVELLKRRFWLLENKNFVYIKACVLFIKALVIVLPVISSDV